MGQLKKHFATLIIGAFGFVVALVWKDAIMEWLAPILETGDGATMLTIVAILVTFVAIGVIWLISKMFDKERKACMNKKGYVWRDNECQKS